MGESEERRILLGVGGFEKIPREKKGRLKMPHIKINQPTDGWLGTTVEIDGQKISNVTSIDYHVEVDKTPTFSIGIYSNSNIDMEADYIKLDISPVNVESAIKILRSELSKNNPRCNHLGIDNELRKGFLASIKSALEEGFSMPDGVTDDELAEKILDRLIGED